MIAMNGREWLVSNNQADLDKYCNIYKTTAWEESRREDKVIFRQIKNLICGWTIDR
jgi:hypothetical protein